MFYKKDSNTDWKQASGKIHLPDGTILSKDNKLSKSGWIWLPKPPIEYTDWINTKIHF